MSERHSRRDFLITTGLAAVSLVINRPTLGAVLSSAEELTLYIGTYTSGTPGPAGKSEGIYIYRMNPKTAELSPFKAVAGVADPSFLAIDPQRSRLYAVNEIDYFENKPSGSVSAFSIDKKTGDLRFLNKRPTAGASPCHLVVDKTAHYVLVANYTGGSIAVLPIQDDGSLGTMSSFIQHRGSSVIKDRQQAPHAHCIELDHGNRYALAVDLGLDKILVYKFDQRAGKLLPNKVPAVDVNPGDGPRHLKFHPNGKFIYLINELSNTLMAFSYDQAEGLLKHLQTVATLPAGFSGQSSTAEVVISPSGRFLYGSNRGHDSIVSFAIDQSTGMLSFIEHVPTGGKHPRNFTIDPTGKFLLVANRDSDSIVTFSIEVKSGRLHATGKVTTVPKPVCLLF